jgi:hypothetical protein
VPNQISHLGEVLAEMHQGEAEEEHEPKKVPVPTTTRPLNFSSKIQETTPN